MAVLLKEAGTYTGGERINRCNISQNSKVILNEVKRLNKRFKELNFASEFEEMDILYRSLNLDLSEFSESMNIILSRFKEVQRKYNEIIEEEKRVNSKVGRFLDFFGRGKRKDNLKSKKYALKIKMDFISQILDTCLYELDYIEENNSRLFQFGDKADNAKNEFITHRTYLNRISKPVFEFNGIVRNYSGNFNDLSLEYLRQVDEWGMSVALTKEEAERVVSGDKFIAGDLEQRIYSGNRNYFKQSKNDWRKVFDEEDINENFRMYQNMITLNRISRRISESKMNIERYKNELNAVKSGLKFLKLN
ncbi:MAG: hypothetical protein QW727_00490 [Candidatus Pacearchaeota archaeon]